MNGRYRNLIMCCKINVNQSYEKMRDLSPRFRNNLRQYLDLSLHGDAEEGDEVHDEDRPEHRDVENLEKGTAESNHLKSTVSFNQNTKPKKVQRKAIT